MGEATRQARQQVGAARDTVSTEADRLGESARASLDIRAKMRRDPVRTTAMGAGLAFLALGGPRRTLGRVGRLFGRGGPKPKSLLPEEVERIVAGLGEREGDVRAALERGFADYLESKEGKRAKASRSRSFWRMFDTMSGPLTARASRQLADRLLSPQQATPDRAEASDPAGPRSGGFGTTPRANSGK